MSLQSLREDIEKAVPQSMWGCFKCREKIIKQIAETLESIGYDYCVKPSEQDKE